MTAREELRALVLAPFKDAPNPAVEEYAEKLLDAHQVEARQPRRGDAVEAWLKGRRDEYREQTDEWFLIDEVLDQYRLHADTDTPLDQHVCERGMTDDCPDCYEVSKGREF